MSHCYSKYTTRFVLLSAVLLLSGCVTIQKVPVPDEVQEGPVEAVREIVDASPELVNIRNEELEEYVEKKGVIFAKSEFQGLLETRYVKLFFQDQDDPNNQFQLHIGENSGQKRFPWEVKTVKPGYFFVELPVGRYKISSITIPVGSTTATENMDVDVEVVADTISYVGTLSMVGTKEKIRLGGVPVIKPGFEYTLEILDQHEEGLDAFKRNYPDFPHNISIKLMEVNQGANGVND